MNIEQAVELIYTGLVSEESVPVKLRAYHELDRELLAQVQEALDFAIEYYKGEPLIPKKLAAALVDIYGALSEYIGTCVSEDAVTLLDINNTVPNDMYKEDIEGKFPYTQKDTFMGFHCGNTASGKLAFCEMKYQMIMARSLPIEVTQGTLEGDIKPGDITFYRLQSTSDNVLRAYVAQGEVLPVATKSFGSIGVFAIPEMGRFYRHVLIEKNYPHHGAVAFGHFGKALFEVFKYIGVPVEEIGYNQPKGVRYPTENPWG